MAEQKMTTIGCVCGTDTGRHALLCPGKNVSAPPVATEQDREFEGPCAWVTDDAVLFVVTSPYSDLMRAAGDGNKALAEQGYPEWLNAVTVTGAYRSTLWVSPDIVNEEQWPDSCVSESEVRGWVRLFRWELEEFEEFDRG